MAVQKVTEVKSLLRKLHEQISNTLSGDSDVAKDAVVDLSEILTSSFSYEDEELCMSLLFNKGGLTEFCKVVANDSKFVSAKKDALELLKCLLDQKTSLLLKYSNILEKLCRQLYNADISSKVRCSALNLLCTLLIKAIHQLDFEDFDFNRFVNQLCLDIKGNKGSLVTYHQLVTLGVLSHSCPEKIREKSNLIFKVFKDQLVKKTGRQPDLTVAAGAVRGISYYFNHFPQGLGDNSGFYAQLYPDIHKLLNPDLRLPKRDVQRAALELIHNHGSKFANHLLKRHEILFKWLSTWCRSHNRDDHKVALKAMDTFIVVLTNTIELQEDKNQGIIVFKFLLKEFNEMLESSRSASHISLAVKGYGLLAGACKIYLTPNDVFKMFSRILAVSHQGFFQSSEMLETKVANLPSFIESLGFIISKSDIVTVGMVDSLLQLSLALVENFPYVSQFKTFLAYRALFTLFSALKSHSDVYRNFLHNFVYHFIVHTCSHEPLVDKDQEEGILSSSDPEEEKWTSTGGIKGKLESYKDYLPLWKAFLSPEAVGGIKVTGKSSSTLTKISYQMYEEFFECSLEISEKLDLKTYKSQQEDDVEEISTIPDEASSDLIKGLKAKTPKDFQVYLNLCCLMEAVVPLQSEISLDCHLSRLFIYYVKRSSLEPLVSTHYSIITLFLSSANYIKYFESESNSEMETTKHLLTGYVMEVLQKCKQYKDQLLVSCLTLVLRLPISIVKQILHKLVSPLQMSLHMGLSYLPIARISIIALQLWLQYLNKEEIEILYPKVLPTLLPYLRSKESLSEAEMQTRIISVKMSLAKQRRKVDKKKIEEGKRIEDSEMRKIQLLILQLLGHLEQGLCFSMITNQSETILERSIAWDTQKHIHFAMPFQNLKLEVYFDDFLPTIIDRALNSSDRQIKVASCELFHSLIILMIGTGHQQSEKTQNKQPMTALYLRVFEAVLALSCDADQVTRQLFLTLTFQIIHWFTNNKSFEHPDTMALLQVILDGIVTPNDPSLRDLSARCLSEYLIWSRKQSRSRDQAQLNIKSVLKRIVSFGNHPSAYKRLGGCLAWNSIYREVREDDSICDEWMILLLDTFITCLGYCQEDDPVIGIVNQCQAAIGHVKRILKERCSIFNKPSSSRRVTNEMEQGTLRDVLRWLFQKISSTNEYVRHSSMELVMELASVTIGCKSGNDFIARQMGSDNLCTLEIIERSIREEKTHEIKYKDVVYRIKNLSGCLDAYVWIMSKNVCKIEDMFSSESVQLFSELNYFLMLFGNTKAELLFEREFMSRKDESDIVITLAHLEKLDKLRCTVIVRIIDFIHCLLVNNNISVINEKTILNANMRKILLLCIFDPSQIGFNIKDTEVTNNLPQRMQDLFRWMLKRLPEATISQLKEDLCEYLRDVAFDSLDNLSCELDAKTIIPLNALCTISGIEVLHLSGWTLEKFDISCISTKSLNWLENVLFMKEDDNEHPKEVNSKHHSFIRKYLQLGLILNSVNRSRLLDLLTCNTKVFDVDGREIKKGAHVINVLGDIPFILLLEDSSLCVSHVLGMFSRGEIIEGIDLMTYLMKLLVKNAQLRKRFSSNLLQSFLHHWEMLYSSCSGNVDNKLAFLNLVMTSFMADKDGIISGKLKSGDDIGKVVVSFFKLFICDPLLNLTSKSNALKLLPFFLNEQTSESIVKETLQNFRLSHLPLKFSEFELGSLREKELKTVVLELLFALELTVDLHLFEFVVRLFCGDEVQRYDDKLQATLQHIMSSVPVTKQIEILKFLFDFSQKTGNQTLRVQVLERIFISCLHHASDTAILHFFTENIAVIMTLLTCSVSGRSDEQLKNIITKYMAFLLIQILFSKLPKDQLFAPGAPITSAYDSKDSSGKELTKEILKRSVRPAKGELRHDLTHQELRRKCSCSAYNALIAVLSNVQDQLKFYNNFLFSEVSTKDEAIFECLIDVTKKYEFDIEVNFDATKRDRFVAVHRGVSNGAGPEDRVRAGTVQYLASHYLYDSSLKEDLSQYDFSTAVVLTQSASVSSNRESFGNISDGGMSMVKLDQSDFNSHEVMPNLITIIKHLVDKNIMNLYSDEEPPHPSDLPQWMTFFKAKLEDRSTKDNVKLFILRLIINTEDIFGCYGNLFVEPMLSVFVDGVIGRKINYFIADMFVTILSWGKRAIPSNKYLVQEVVGSLVFYTPHTRADIFKYNLNLIKTLVETWKSVITAPSDVIVSFLEDVNGEQREVEAGLQIAGILLANEISPFPVENKFEKERFISLINTSLTAKTAAIYSAAAEVMGLCLKFLFSHEEDLDEELLDKISQNLLTFLTSQSSQRGQALSCVYFIHKHYPKIIEKLINRLLSFLPRLYGIHKERILQCLVSYAPHLDDIFAHLKEQNILDSLTIKEAKTQLVSLELINASLPRLEVHEIKYFLPGIVTFEYHSAPSCRELMYEMLIWVYNKFNGVDGEDAETLAKAAQVILLKGIKDEDSILRQFVKNFWIQKAKDLSLSDRLLFVLENLYTNETDDCFLMMATHILLEATHSTADFMRPIFPYPLTECIFREMKVSPGWKAQHASMIPLFVDTQVSGENSFDSLVSMTQDGYQEAEMESTSNVNRGPQATQNYAFSVTQNQGTSFGDTYNWITGSTLDTTAADKEFQITHASHHSASSGLFFTEGNRTEFRRQRIGNSSMNPPDTTDGGTSTSHKSKMETLLLRRRFVTNQNQDREKQTVHFARQEEIRRKIRHQIQKERKMKREAQVTIYRQYRVGELPDVQIPHKALISPLQALAERDESVASELFQLLCESIMKRASTLMSTEDEATWKQKIFSSIKQIIATSEACYPHIVSPLLHLAMVFDIDVNPEEISSVCMRNNLEPLGILVLERHYMKQKQSEKEPVRKKARKEYSQSQNKGDTSLWLNIAEMYKNLSNWDSVLGILKSEIGELKEETIKALEAESEKNHFEAYKNYISALKKDDWDSGSMPSNQEQQVWEEWFITSAENLGQWEKIEEFIEGRFLSEGSTRIDKLNRVWNLPRHVLSYVLTSLVNAKLMKILQGSKDDGGLCQFINDSRKNERYRVILENEMGLQLGVLAVNQEEMELARSLLRSTQISLLSRLVHCSLLSSRSMMEYLKSVQAISELHDFTSLKCFFSNDGNCDNQELAVRKVISTWRTRNFEDSDNIVQTQFTTSYRDMYLHFLRPLVQSDYQFLNDSKASSHVSMIKLSLANRNPHLAQNHLTKLERIPKDNAMECQFAFLKTEASIIRANLKDPLGKLKYSVEAWCKYLGKVNDHLSHNPSQHVEAQYLIQESLLCFNICEAIRDLKDEWNPNEKCMKILSSKFSNVDTNCSKSWFRTLLNCSHNSLTKASDLFNNTNESGYQKITAYKNMDEVIARFYEDILEEWKDYVDNEEFTGSFVRSVLKGMASGSRNAHHTFPRLIYLLEQQTSISKIFMKESKKVPVWMYLLWISHILIYLDKAPGPSLHPIIIQLAETYPQAVIYAFEVSKESYKFTGSYGPYAKKTCKEVQQILDKNSLAYNFISAISAVHLPHTELKDKINSIAKLKDKTKVCSLLKDCYKMLRPEKQPNSPNERGSMYHNHDRFLKKAYECLTKNFGQNGEKLNNLDIKALQELNKDMLKSLSFGTNDIKHFSRNLSNYSPWLATFNSSNHIQEIEIPGQYQGLCKPLPEYHTKISSFNLNVMLMESLRVPMRVTINGSDEKEHSFLVKSGEDLRTDQRIENIFSLMNNTYNEHCSTRLSCKPLLITYQVIPLSVDVGLLEWVSHTQPFMNFMTSFITDVEKKWIDDANVMYSKNNSWVIGPTIKKREDCVKGYEKIVNTLPWDLMRRGLIKLSVNHEGFFYLRNAFISSYATLCVSHWLLGIGDRHLANILFNKNTGYVVGIDFGHHFESATQFLPVPELIPFRLTNQIVNVMQPLGIKGQFRETMISCLSALKKQHKVIFATVQAFVKEPTKDWLYFVSRLGSLQHSDKLENFSMSKMDDFKKKLCGGNPMDVFITAVSSNQNIIHNKKVSEFKDIVSGKGFSERSRVQIKTSGETLSVSEQVDILIDQATDPNILGRTWIGWKPFM